LGASLYPLFVNLQGRSCLVIGGGDVATRKVTDLLNAGAKVTVVSAQATTQLGALCGQITWIERDYRPGDEKGAELVFIATDNPEVNRLAAQNAKAAGAWVNAADAPGECDFYVPSKVTRGDLVIALSASGKAPALTRRLRMELERQFGPEYEAYVALLGYAREKVKALPGLDSKTRGEMMRQLLDLDLLTLIRNGREEDAREEVEAWISRWSA